MPDELSAKRKFPCPACGAEAEWNPAKQMLVCPFCGTQSQAEIKSDGTLVEENDLITALNSIPEGDRGWAAEKKTVRCQSCNAISVFDATRVAQRCDFCGSPALIEVDDIKAPIRPSSLLPFKVDQGTVRESIRQWYGSHWFAPNNLKGKALTDTLHGLYLPYWTFDAHVAAQWQAEAGYHYTVTDDQGRSEQRTRWEYASGDIDHFFDDELVPASRGVSAALLEKLAPFPTTKELVPYDPGYISGWVVEQYQIDLTAAAQDARGRMDNAVKQMCISQIPGDTYRGLQVNSEYSAQTFKHVLLPVWILSYVYGARSYQVAVNGCTGKIGGNYPLSWVKILIVSVIALLIIFFIASHSK
ncbi:MAG: zinc ribbon domain-containing protein [Verrucomicrobia bacterium]|nr:zinc ribbon domain-containing protein [Verrucomicrobiota bacterium]